VQHDGRRGSRDELERSIFIFSTFERELSDAEKRPETKAGSLCCRKN
jgi:hypothetical protein